MSQVDLWIGGQDIGIVYTWLQVFHCCCCGTKPATSSVPEVEQLINGNLTQWISLWKSRSYTRGRITPTIVKRRVMCRRSMMAMEVFVPILRFRGAILLLRQKCWVIWCKIMWTGTCGRTQFPNWAMPVGERVTTFGLHRAWSRVKYWIEKGVSKNWDTPKWMVYKAKRLEACVLFPVFSTPFRPEAKNNWTKFCGGARGLEMKLGQWAISHDQKLGSSISMERQSPPKWFAIAISYMTS